MNRENVAERIGVESLVDFIKDSFLTGKNEATDLVGNHFNKSMEKIINSDNSEVKAFLILSELIEIKNYLIDNSYIEFSQVLAQSKKYIFSFLSMTKTDIDKIIDVANYILDYNEFIKSSDFDVENQIRNFKNNSLKYHSVLEFSSKSPLYFENLNKLNLVEDFHWNWNNFDKGLKLILMNHSSEMMSVKANAQVEIEQFKKEYERKIEEIEGRSKEEIERLKFELKSNEQLLKFNTEYYDKHYKENPIQFYNTYFGDNLPFIIELYKFLNKNNLYKYGFSYFYQCLLENDKEMIHLNSDKKNNFVGRIFFKLSDFLVKDYKDNYIKFFHSKFTLNNRPIPKDFRTNHMKVNYDKEMEYELVEIDEFFEKLSKIYIKY